MELDEIVQLCEKRGFVWASSEIYGSLSGFYDFGPLGVLLKDKIINSWRKRFVKDNIYEIHTTTITPKKIWKASGHLEGFNDTLIECTKCHARFRADHLVEDALKISVDGLPAADINKLIQENKIKCPKCKGSFADVKLFNLMFKTNAGPIGDESSEVYLRPETAQAMFVLFKRVQQSMRAKLPFGIAQVGRSYRNEISPRQFLFRLREFHHMEFEFFVNPKEKDNCIFWKDVKNKKLLLYSKENQKNKEKPELIPLDSAVKKKIINSQWLAYWVNEVYNWFVSLGINEKNLRLRQHLPTELAHYAADCWDIEYNFPFGWKEVAGIADRTDFDLKTHMKHSNQDLTYFDEKTNQKITPHVIEPSWGLERAFLVVLFDSAVKEKERDVLRFSPKIAPISVAVFPLVNKDKLPEKAKEIYDTLKQDFDAFYDDSGSIGRRYRRMDEIGTLFCLTIDYQTLKDKKVTLRDRDSMKQVRVKIKDLNSVLCDLINQKVKFSSISKNRK